MMRYIRHAKAEKTISSGILNESGMRFLICISMFQVGTQRPA
jgi:hypothetical protein